MLAIAAQVCAPSSPDRSSRCKCQPTTSLSSSISACTQLQPGSCLPCTHRAKPVKAALSGSHCFHNASDVNIELLSGLNCRRGRRLHWHSSNHYHSSSLNSSSCSHKKLTRSLTSGSRRGSSGPDFALSSYQVREHCPFIKV